MGISDVARLDGQTTRASPFCEECDDPERCAAELLVRPVVRGRHHSLGGPLTDPLLTARELADLLGLKPATVLDKWERGELPGYKIGRAVRFDADEILRLTRKEARPLVPVRSEQ